MHEYSNHLTHRYIEEQVVKFPILLSAAETYIVIAKKIFDDAIINNGLTMNELPPFTMSALCMVKTAENEQYWEDIKYSQLDSIYSILHNTNGIPPRETIMNVTR